MYIFAEDKFSPIRRRRKFTSNVISPPQTPVDGDAMVLSATRGDIMTDLVPIIIIISRVVE